jgi:hypothetical protein
VAFLRHCFHTRDSQRRSGSPTRRPRSALSICHSVSRPSRYRALGRPTGSGHLATVRGRKHQKRTSGRSIRRPVHILLTRVDLLALISREKRKTVRVCDVKLPYRSHSAQVASRNRHQLSR